VHPGDATSKKSQRSQRIAITTGLNSKIHIESFRTLPSLHQADEEGSLFYLGQYLPRSVRGNQAIPYTTTYPCSFTLGKPFLIYVQAMDHSLGALRAQNNDQGHEQAIYYLSRTMIGAEYRYNLIEKECLALVSVVQKM